jgi:hypothetical protein
MGNRMYFFNGNTVFKDPSMKASPVLLSWGFIRRMQHFKGKSMKWSGTNISLFFLDILIYFSYILAADTFCTAVSPELIFTPLE